jgi:hypothetical protein
MDITQQQLKDWSACTDGYKWACGILKDKPRKLSIQNLSTYVVISIALVIVKAGTPV